MNILSTISENIRLNNLKGKSNEQVKNAFFANYLAGLLLLKIQDFKGLRLINDKQNSSLQRFTASMSDVNFWGKALFYPEDPTVQAMLLPNHAELLKVESHKLTKMSVKNIIDVLHTSPEQINWGEVYARLILLRHRFAVQSSHFDRILRALVKWDDISEIHRKYTVSVALQYLMQADQKSALIPRLRELSTSTLFTTGLELVSKLIGFKKLTEDGEGGGDGGTSAGNIASTDSSSTNNIISQPEFNCQQNNWMGGIYKLKKMAPYQVTRKKKITFKDGKIVLKRPKKFKALKFKAPEFLKIKKENS